MVLINLDMEVLRFALRFEFKASNNEAEYEALIVGLELAKRLRVENLHIHCDSQLIVNQVKGDYTAKEPNMVAYLAKTLNNLEAISWFEIIQVPCKENAEADALAWLASGIDEGEEGSVPIEVLTRPYISRGDIGAIGEAPPPPLWINPLVEYISKGILPEDREEAKNLRSLASK